METHLPPDLGVKRVELVHLKVLVYTWAKFKGRDIYLSKGPVIHLWWKFSRSSYVYTFGGKFIPIHNLLKCDPVELAVKEPDFFDVVILAAEASLPRQRQLRVLRALQQELKL